MDSAREGPEIVFDPLPGEALSRLVSENVVSANVARTGVSDWHPVGFFLKSPRGEWLGGLTGYIWGGWLHVNFLWVSEALRGQSPRDAIDGCGRGDGEGTRRRWRDTGDFHVAGARILQQTGLLDIWSSR
jgi:hypothetical protein